MTKKDIQTETLPTEWFDKGQALPIIRYYFSNAKKRIRIATGFFSVRGYNLIRSSTKDKKISILVGLDDPGKDRVRLALIQEILRDLKTGLDEDRRKAVAELVSKMENKEFRIIDARAKQHHSKLFLVDKDIAIIASSNVSQRGMLDAIEAGSVIKDREKVRFYLNKFRSHYQAPDCYDITQELIAALKRWLQMVSPFDIYLKTLMSLKTLEEIDNERPSYKKPVGYQQDIISRVMRQLDDYKGAMLVASTGLGKTVMATDIAMRLRNRLGFLNVLVIGPKPVKKQWKQHLRSVGIIPDFFNHYALNTKDLQRNKHAEELQAILDQELDERWLIIIDESHEFRNRFKFDFHDGTPQKREHTSYEKIRPAIKNSGCYVLLLTATPYAKDLKNINNQLYLLPHLGPRTALFKDIDGANAWKVAKISELKSLAPVSILTTPYVAKYYGNEDENGTYIEFSSGKKYFPNISLFAIHAQLVLEEEIGDILDNRILGRGSSRARSQPIENQAKVAWGSSPWALQEVLEKSSASSEDGGYNVRDFKFTLEERKRIIAPVLNQVRHVTAEDDKKFQALLAFLTTYCKKPEKAIIFTERHATAHYLEENLNQYLPQKTIESTIQVIERGKYQLKKEQETQEFFQKFAPIAHNIDSSEDQIDILIATDAHGIGINLQDAMTVINYDLSWTTIEPDQRAGRILRFWNEARNVNLCTFIPILKNDSNRKKISTSIQNRWHRLAQRHFQAKTFLDLPTITSKSNQEIHLADLGGDQFIEKIGQLDYESVHENEMGTSEIFEHMAVLERNKLYATHISDDIISATTYTGNRTLVYVLLKIKEKYFWLLYDTKSKEILEGKRDDQMLNIISSSEDTKIIAVDPNEVEKLANKGIKKWAQNHKCTVSDIQRICTLMLIPENQVPDFHSMLNIEE